MHTAIPLPVPCKRAPWNKGRLIGQKRPLKPKDVNSARLLGARLPKHCIDRPVRRQASTPRIAGISGTL
jgi:hypothetical protein